MIRKLLTMAAAIGGLQGPALAQETIKMGLLNIDGGAFSVYAPAIRDAAMFAVDTLNAQGGALGRKYELVTQVHSGTPAAAIAAASKLVEQQGVSFFAGLNGSATSLAIASKLPGMNALFVDSTAATDDLTGKNCQPNYFRVGVNDTMMTNALRALLKQAGLKSWNILSVDYSAGHDFAKTFSGLVREQGGTAQVTLFAPVTTTDFGSYISQLSAKPAEGLMVFFPGAGAIALAKQQQQFGLFSRYRNVLAHFSFTNDILLEAQGDTTVGVTTTISYEWPMAGERNEAFVKAFEARFKRKPNYLEADMFMSYTLLHAAIVKARSTDVGAVRSALAGLKVSTIVGDVEMRAADHQLLRPVAIVQVSKTSDGKAEMVLKSVETAASTQAPVSSDCKM